MSWFKNIFRNNGEATISKEELLHHRVCPNCWGRQEYDNTFKEKYKDFTKSNINHDKTQRKAFILQFVETNVTGIHLKTDGDKVHCPKCNTNYKS